MGLPEDLLQQARHLATHDRGKPKQASIRRAISAAYYALFHLLTSEATARFVSGTGRDDVRELLSRSFVHATMAAACADITKKTPPQKYRAAFWNGWPPQLLNVATTFSELQRARHEADYDFSRNINRAEAIDAVARTAVAFVDWAAVRKTAEADGFLMIRLVHRKQTQQD